MQITLTKPVVIQNEDQFRFQAEKIKVNISMDEMDQILDSQCSAKQPIGMSVMEGPQAVEFLKKVLAKHPDLKDKLDQQTQQIIDDLTKENPVNADEKETE